MYKIKEYFVQSYRSQLGNRNVEAENAVLWPKYKEAIDTLVFSSDGEKLHYTKYITKEIAAVYYKLLKEEVNSELRRFFEDVSDNEFLNRYERYKYDYNLRELVSDKYDEYSPFSSEGHSSWNSGKEFLMKYAQKLIYEGLEKRGLRKDDDSFFRTALLSGIAGALGMFVFG